MCGWSIVWISRMKLRATPIATPGELRRESSEREQREQSRDPDGDRRRLPAADVGDRLREHRERVARRLLDSHDLRQLADRDVEAERHDEALEDWAGGEAADEAHPGKAAAT